MLIQVHWDNILHSPCRIPALPAARLPLLLERLDGDAVHPLHVVPHRHVVHLHARVHGRSAEAARKTDVTSCVKATKSMDDKVVIGGGGGD